MSKRWIRLWAELPHDPKFRTIARITSQPTANVIAVYIHMLVCAADDSDLDVTQCDAARRGKIVSWQDEDIATALDLETEEITQIREAMQGRLLEGEYIKGWDARQPKREDSSKERTKRWREGKKNENVTQCDADVTQCDSKNKNKIKIKDLNKEKVKKEKVRLEDFRVLDKHIEYAERKGCPSPHTQIEKFKNYYLARPKRMKEISNWDLTFYNWLTNAITFQQPGGINHAANQRSITKSKTQMHWDATAPGAFSGTELERLYPTYPSKD
jgi:hypothetical protein